MSARNAALSGFAIAVLVLVVAWVFELPLSHVAALAPVVVLVAAAVAGLTVFWGRAALEGLRTAKHPRLIVWASVAIVVVGIVLTVMGVQLPRE